MITRQKQQGAGFTLLEVLIGMSIMSIMMLLLFASLRVCVQSWNAGEKKIAQVSQAATVQAFLYNKLQMALPLEDASSAEKQFSFRGNAQQLQFVAAMPASAARLGLQLFTLSLMPTQDNKGNELQVDITPFFSQSDSAQWQEEQVVILDKIHSLRFAYFNADQAQGNVGWQEQWLDKDTLPALLSVDVELLNGELWPTIVVDLKVDTVLRGGGSSSSLNPFGIINGKFTGR
ncbi:MAG: prepilin-type N-terminal cleavage/methylation domain-containing protein [Methyloprofundus sp.]|nr:prepilin-type N-terminal cleavage/methylation domain-containing protein [Methyloprofundus sp.]